MVASVADPHRHALLRRALGLSALSVGLSAVTGVVAVVVALASGALSLLGFGVDAVIDASASAALIVRFRIESRDPARAVRAERLAERVVGAALLALAAYLANGAVSALVAGAHPTPTLAGIAIPVIGVLALPAIAVAKYRTATALGSNALRADSLLTGVAAALGAVSLASIVLSEALGITWADAVGALVMAPVIAREGWLSVRLAERS